MADHDTGGKKKKQLDDAFSSFFAKFAAEDPFIHKRKAMRSEVFVTPKRVEKNDKIEKLWSEFSKLEGANKFEEIITCMNSIIELDPGNASAWLNKAGALHNLAENFDGKQYLDKQKEAKKCCLQALELKPDWWNAANNLGIMCESLGELEDAKKYYDKAIKLDPTSSFSWINKGNVLSKSSNIEENKEALDCYDKAIKLDPKNLTTFGALAGKGALLAMKFEKYEEALKCIDDAIIAVTEEILALFEKRKTEKYEDPSALIQVFANLAINKGAALLQLKKYEIAINWFEQQTKWIPAWPYPYERLAHTLTLVGKDEEALEYFDDAIKFSRQQPKEFGGRGAEGQPLPESAPKHAYHFVLYYEPIHIDEILIQKGNTLLRLKKPIDAIRCFNEAFELNPTLTGYRSNPKQLLEISRACFNSILDLIFGDDTDRNLESAIKRLDSGAIEKLMNIIDMLQTAIKKAHQLDTFADDKELIHILDTLGEILKSLKKNHPEIP